MAGIKIPVGTDNTGLDAGVAAAQGKLNSFKGFALRTFAAIGAASGVVNVLRKTADMFDRIGKVSRSGIDAGFLQQLYLGSEHAGTSFEASVKAIRMFIKEIRSADGPAAEIVATLEALGFSIDDLKQLSAQDLFVTMAGAIGNLDDESDQLAATTGLLGTRYGDLVPLLQDIAHRGLPEVTEATEDQIATIEQFNDDVTTLQHTLTTTFAPVLSLIAKLFRHGALSIEVMSDQLAHLFAFLQTRASRSLSLIEGLFTFDRDKIRKSLDGALYELEYFASEAKRITKDGFADMVDIYTNPTEQSQRTGTGKYNPQSQEFEIGEEGEKAIANYNKLAARWRGAREKFREQRERDRQRDLDGQERELMGEGKKLATDYLDRNARFKDPSSITASTMRSIGGGGAVSTPNEKIVADLNRKQLTKLGEIKAALDTIARQRGTSKEFK